MASYALYVTNIMAHNPCHLYNTGVPNNELHSQLQPKKIKAKPLI